MSPPRTYDEWKTTDPADEWLGPDPRERDPDEEYERWRDEQYGDDYREIEP